MLKCHSRCPLASSLKNHVGIHAIQPKSPRLLQLPQLRRVDFAPCANGKRSVPARVSARMYHCLVLLRKTNAVGIDAVAVTILREMVGNDVVNGPPGAKVHAADAELTFVEWFYEAAQGVPEVQVN